MKHIVIFFLTIMAVGVFAQEDKFSFSLKEATDYALQHNKTILNANQDIILANSQIREAKGVLYPQLNASMDYMTNFNYEFAFEFGGGSSDPPDIDYSVMDLGDYEVLNAIDQMFGSSEGSTIVMEDQANANLQVSQLLFSGQAWIGVQMAKVGKKVVENKLVLTELDVRENITSSYYLVLVTEELLRIINNTKDNLNSILKHTSDMYSAGLAEQTDVDQLKIQVSQIENSRKAMERNLQLNYNMMKFFMGIESADEIKLTDDLDIFVKNAEDESLHNMELDLTNNPTYQIMLAQEEIGKKTVDMQQWAYAPTLSGFYNYKEKLLTTSFDMSPKNAAGLTLNLPLYSGGTKKSKLSQAKIELDKISRNISLLEDQLALQDNQLSFELKSSYENYITQKENIIIARRVYESINNKYKQGLVSSLDLTQANTNYLQAENNYVSSILDLLQSKLKLDKLYNNL